MHAELEKASNALLHACRRGRAIIGSELSSTQRRAELVSDMHTILGNYRSLWTARNRPGGLQDSASALEARLDEYDGN
ncbi:MAG: hypothetical protein M3360_10980 [Actinomycetota bacterium]|nr:hypothetical protein [Actinomycetota bacterium]